MKGQTYRGGILSTNGVMIWIDEEDFERLNASNWHVDKAGYAIGSGKAMKRHFMHREVLQLGPGGPHVDHINHCRHDNQKSNLRLATPAQNQWNRKHSDWVWFDRRCPKRPWRVTVMANRKPHYAQCATKEEAIILKRKMAKEVRGEFFPK